MYLLQINTQSDWELFFGHFHPVVVHLPIGILFVACVLELVRLKTKTELLNTGISIILFWGFISAVLSCLFGWFLSSSGDYNEDTLFWHQWLGISIAIITGLLFLIKNRKHNINTAPRKLYTPLIIGVMLLTIIAGHLGGNMTHGEDYLTSNTPQPFRDWLGFASKVNKAERTKITDINEAVIYKDLIEPVLEIKCWSCHNASKKKGKLRMDTEELLWKGGKHGVVIKANDVAGSEMIKRLLLPKADDKRMPPKGKPEPTPEEIELIKWWVANGASFTSKVKDVKQTGAVETYFKKYSIDGSGSGFTNEKKLVESAVFMQKVNAADKNTIELMKKENLLISLVSQNQPFIEISAVNAPMFNDSSAKIIHKLSSQLVWLKLSDTKITDVGIIELRPCKNLVRLYLENTSITNNSIPVIKQFQNLEYLNFVGTGIDDKGLLELANMKNLKQVYCWQSNVTEKGIAKLKEKNPGIKVIFGEILLK